jgi:hypothetical protein
MNGNKSRATGRAVITEINDLLKSHMNCKFRFFSFALRALESKEED